MTTRMSQVIERLQRLPAEQQDTVANLILHELDEDERWLQTTATHEAKLGKLVADVLRADANGECDDLGPEKL